MSLEGTVQNGVVIFDESGALPDGVRVSVTLQDPVAKKPTLKERLRRLAGSVDDLPTDMAQNYVPHVQTISRINR